MEFAFLQMARKLKKRVNNNLLRLNDSNVSFEIITVLANHTVSNYHQLFQELSDLNVPAKLLPLFGGPQSRNLQGLKFQEMKCFIQ